MDLFEQQVTDKLQSAFLFVWGDEAPPETATTADPMEVQVYKDTLIQ